MHLAQINIAKARENLDSPVMQGFVERLDEINALAERSDGFVWRLQTDDGDATSIQAFDDPRIIINMSVWESIDALKHFVYQSDHIALLQQRKDWFCQMEKKSQVMWWLPAGVIPTVEDGKNKLDQLQSNGPTTAAFTFAKPFSSS